MSRRRFENLDPERQQKLFDSAASEFGEKGYDAASLNRILEKSGMSKSSLYYYFDDKADLFTTMLERAIAFLLNKAGGFDLDALTAANYWSELEELTLKMVRVMNGDGWYIKLGRAFYRMRGPSEAAPVRQTFEIIRRWTERFIAKGQSLEVIRTDLPKSLLVDCTMALGEAFDRWSVDHWNELTADERIEVTRQQIGVLRRVLETGQRP